MARPNYAVGSSRQLMAAAAAAAHREMEVERWKMVSSMGVETASCTRHTEMWYCVFVLN